MSEQTPTPYGDPEPSRAASRDVWGPPTATAEPARPAEGTPWWSEPQAQQTQRPARFAPDDPNRYESTPTYETTPGGSSWQPGEAPAARPGPPRGPDSRLRTAVVAALVAGLIGGGIGAGAVVVYDDNRGGAAGSASGATLQQVTDNSARDKRPAGSVAAIAAAVLPSVVTIKEKSAQGSGTGSGVVIDGAAGYILTNNHVVAEVAAGGGGVSLQIIPNGGSTADAVDATVVGTDPASDLAVIKVATTGLKAATLGRSADLVVGDTVIAIGAPLGLAGTVTQGIVSALNRNVDVPGGSGTTSQTLTGSIQTDAAINPGNSGGALVDSNGRVVGINSAIASTGGSGGGQSGNIGVGFAIPIDYAAPIARDIISTGKATHPYIGVNLGGADVGGEREARIVAPLDPSGSPAGPAVVSGGPADKAGLREGDLVTMVDGDKVANATELVAAIRRHKVGDVLTLTYTRGTDTKTAKVTLQNNPRL